MMGNSQEEVAEQLSIAVGENDAMRRQLAGAQKYSNEASERALKAEAALAVAVQDRDVAVKAEAERLTGIYLSDLAHWEKKCNDLEKQNESLSIRLAAAIQSHGDDTLAQLYTLIEKLPAGWCCVIRRGEKGSIRNEQDKIVEVVDQGKMLPAVRRMTEPNLEDAAAIMDSMSMPETAQRAWAKIKESLRWE